MNAHTALLDHDSSASTLRYYGVPNSTAAFWLAALFAFALHGALFWGFPGHSPAQVVPPPDIVKIIDWAIPPVLDPPEPKAPKLNEDPPAVRVPSLTDAPRPVDIKTPFLQKVEPVVPLDKEGVKNTVVSIPIIYRRGPGGDGPTRTYDPAELDRMPEAVTKVSPDYPFELKRSGVGGTVRAGFIVDSRGNVVSLRVISSTNPGFERTTLEALAKWKFRPGLKNGRKVDTRMEQPIEFSAQP
jgi:protein TonB